MAGVGVAGEADVQERLAILRAAFFFGERGVAGDSLRDVLVLAEDQRNVEAGVSDLWMLGEQGFSAAVVGGGGFNESSDLALKIELGLLDEGLKFRPAGETLFAGDGELGVVERWKFVAWICVARDAAEGGVFARLCGFEERLGLFLVELEIQADGIGVGRHATSFRFAQCPQDGPKEGALRLEKTWWENPFPRTGGARLRQGNCIAGAGLKRKKKILRERKAETWRFGEGTSSRRGVVGVLGLRDTSLPADRPTLCKRRKG
jgi:hypothetical protein